MIKANMVVRVSFSSTENNKELPTIPSTHPAIPVHLTNSSTDTPSEDVPSISCLPQSNRPPLWKQNEVIQGLFSLRKNIECSDGSVAYLLCRQWWMKWKEYVNNGGPEPSAIDNSGLISDDSKICLVKSNGEAIAEMRITLRKGLDDKTDFVTVNGEIWEAFHFWYGGGPPIPRFYKAWTGREKFNTYIDIYARSPPTLNEAKATHRRSIEAAASDVVHAASEDAGDVISSAPSVMLTDVDTETIKPSADTSSLSKSDDVKIAALRIDANDKAEAEKVMSVSTAELLVRSKSTDFNDCGASDALERAIRASATGSSEDGVDIGAKLAAVLENGGSLSEDCIDQSLMMVATRYCFVCRREAIERCSKCQAVYYCDKDCQKSHWKYHKNWCAAAKAHNHLSSKQFEAKVSVGRRGRVGIMNLGNSCYMSSCLQCLSHIFPLTSHFLSGRFEKQLNRESRDGTGGVLAAEYCNLLKELWFESKSAVSPSAFKKVLGTIRSEYKGLQQQDAHELVELILDKLHEDLNKVQKKPYTERPEGDGSNDAATAAEAWRLHSLREDSFVRDIVGSQMRSQIICPDCGKKAVFFEYQQTLQIAIPRKAAVPSRVLKVYFVPQRSDLVKELRNAAMHAAGSKIPDTTAPSSPGPLFIPSSDDVTRALRPVLFGIAVDASSTCRQIKGEVRQRLLRFTLPGIPVDSGLSAIYELESLMALELGEGDSSLSAMVDDDAVVSAYAESGISILLSSHKKDRVNIFLLQRVRLPDGSVECVGIPSMIQVDPAFTFPRLRFAVWQQLSHLLTASPTSSAVAEGSGENDDGGQSIVPLNPLSHAARQAEKTGDVNLQRAISCLLPLHLVSKSGDPEYTKKISSFRAAVDAEGQVAAKTALEQLKLACGAENWHTISGPIAEAVAGIRVDDEKKRVRSEKLEVLYGSSIPVSGSMKVGDVAPKKSYLFLSVDWTDPWKHAVSAVGEHEKLTFDESSASLLQEHSKSSGALTLEQCLSEHTREELLDQDNAWYCSNCKDHKCARKVVKFWRGNLPSVLVLVLKRFEVKALDGGLMGSFMHREKINSLVDFPLDGLDLSQFCASGGYGAHADGDEEGGDASSIYDLLAVCNHYGRLGSGHYTAYARDWLSDGRLANTWYSYDDDDVTACADGAEVVSRAAYILFYKRR